MIKNLGISYAAIVPEVFLLCAIFVLMVQGLLRGEAGEKVLYFGVKLALFMTMILSLLVMSDPLSLFNGHYEISDVTQLAKAFILLMVFLLCFMSFPHFEREEMRQFEVPILILFSTLGMMILASSSDFMTLFLSIEIVSLTFYILVSIQKNKLQSSEAGLKYFILGALSTAILLYGISLMYGYCGSTDYEGIRSALRAESNTISIGVWAGFVLILVSFAFKLSLAPFHMWLPDVYEGSPTPITAFLSSAPKFAVLFALMRLLSIVFASLYPHVEYLLVGISVVSMLLGAIAALFQTNLKRLLAYSTISHMGYALLGFLNLSSAAQTSVLFYGFIYGVTSLGVFACLLNLRRHGRLIEELRDLSGLAKENKVVACSFAVLLLSLAGLPPLAGFFSKFLVFKTAIDAGFYKTVVIAVIASVIAAAYYLRLIKIMFFDELLSEGGAGRLDRYMSWPTVWMMVGCSIFVLTYILYPDFLLSMILMAFTH